MKYLIILTFLISSVAFADLTVYTSRKEHLVKEVFKQFEKETSIKVSYRTGKSGALIQTIKAEGNNSPADLFMTVDAGNLWFAAKEGIFESTNSKVLGKNIPSHLKDSKNNWFGLSVRARTIAYNFNKVKDGELNSYEDLATEKWKGRICLRTSKKVYNQSLVAMLIGELGYEKAKEVVGGWVKNNVEIFSNDTSVLKSIAAGQCDVGIVNTYYFGRLIKKDPKLPIKLFWPNQKNSYGVHINVSGAGIVKTSKNKKEALRLLEWLSSDKAQSSFASINMEYPANPSIKNDPVVDKWGTFKANSTFHLTKAGILQKDAIKLMNDVNYK
jgi:iron(III) transport system substrate-binding protein